MLSAATGSTVSFDGTSIASTTWIAGHGGPLVLAAHATSFCKEVFGPIVSDLTGLTASFEVRALDQRGHGDSSVVEPPVDWWDLAQDAIAVLDGARGVLGVGHSLGGATLAMAELFAPGTFGALLLIEPVFIDGPITKTEDGPLIRAALKRKHRFASPDAAIESWKGRGPFAQWDDRVLHAYAHGGLRRANGSWELKCRPELEAEFYRAATKHNAFGRLGEIDVAVHVVAGEHSDSHPPSFVESIRTRLRHGTAEIVPASSHFLPMERPRFIARRIASSLDLG